ncbi:MAG: hypothetical protein K2X67_08860 [Burkholderiales bacterium]|nr:hypothetical protein [Burkholderiales bacterium]
MEQTPRVQLPEVRSVPFIRGWYWVVEGWKLFLRKPLTAIVFTAALWAIIFLSGIHGLLAAAVAVLLPVFLGGWVAACDTIARGEPVPVTMFFEGFRRRTAELGAIGGFNVIANLLVLMIVFAAGGDMLGKLMSDPTSVDPAAVAEASARIAQALLLGVVVGLPVAMAVWFAPFAVMLDGVRPLHALAGSLRAMVRNMLPFLLYSVVWLTIGVVLFSVASALFGARAALGICVWLMMPVLVPSVYVSYRDIFRAG